MSNADLTLEAVEDLTPSAKLVYKVLEHADDPLDQAEIADRTMLPRRTVRGALADLEDVGAVSSKTCLLDARKNIYSLDK
ncbi:helix-turn-helix domain-containing protein [Natronolimnohabitans sp. A-GB9]|uniref:helix-turn-helix domain-containing protein n=1 Tax=Natronolimnohabitans sp. A-GB9 TaxID=3069757 RepID=UPI0027B561EA|nr:helix-turn-helix domain-containing protein [Natronolimnohabitans sp. A-GB9]MDQ2052942.1 helix-turn-helix domain-containing protein [Natronolimnohabitans sp. A-GB9]